MWMLINESSDEAQQFFLHQGTFTIGRSAPDTAIALLDQSISRRHATITVSAFDPTGSLEDPSSISIMDSSTFGTQVDDVAITKGHTVGLSHGQRLRVGRKVNLRVIWDRVVACTHGSPPTATAAVASRLGVHLRGSWEKECTHLIMDSAPTATDAAAACAYASNRICIQTAWLDACNAAASGHCTTPWPLATTYQWPRPPLPQRLTAALSVCHPGEAAGNSSRPVVARQPEQGLLSQWALEWHPRCQDPQLQLAAQLSGAAATAWGGPRSPGKRPLLVAPAEVHGISSPAMVISPDLLAAVIMDGQGWVLEAALHLLQANHPDNNKAPVGRGLPDGVIGRKRPAGITSSIAGKRQKKGKAVVETTAEEAAFDPRPNAADVTNGEDDLAGGPQPMTIDISVSEQLLVHTPPQSHRQRQQQHQHQHQQDMPGATSAPNFKGFHRKGAAAARPPTISFTTTTWAQEPANNSQFIQQERQVKQQKIASDALFAASLKPTGFKKLAASQRPTIQLALNRR